MNPPRPTTLSRAVRILVTPESSPPAKEGFHNTFAGYPSSSELGAWFEIEVSVAGMPDPSTGYLATLAQLDKSVRDSIVFLLRNELFHKSDGRRARPAALIHAMAETVSRSLGRPIETLKWNLSPYHILTWSRTMPASTTLCAIFEFAASHRLNDPNRSPVENREFFGKCNKLNGHGHNYRLEVGIEVPAQSAFGMAQLEEIVDRTVIERFDHMNLNIDCPEFHHVNPSVEHIAAVCFEILEEPLKAGGALLKRVRLWETSKTSATVESQ